MKTFKVLVALAAIVMFNISCEQEEELTPVTNVNDLILGHWVVSELTKGNSILTDEVNGYDFYCTNDGHMTVTGNGKNFPGNWSCMNTNSGDTVYRIRIMGCNANDILSECMDDWHLMNTDSLHCYFTSHEASHQRKMTWERVN
jgi:hypothetical protein